MSIRSGGSLFLSRPVVLACLLAGGVLPLAGTPPGTHKVKAAEAQTPQLVEAFMKGPISIAAKVIRCQGKPEESVLPLFQVPVLKFQDRLELSFAGEAFDRRVTAADWSLIVVFLPKTVAPTDQGVVSFRLKHQGDRMVVPSIQVPYDSIPMLFLIPDKNGRKKVLKDLNAHLESFRTLCSKIADLSGQRAAVDKFIEDLEAIDKNLSPAQYDNAVLGFLHTYGSTVSVDVQSLGSKGSSNLEKCQFLTQEFQKTNILVPDSTNSAPVTAQATVVAGGGRPASAYVSIVFDVATIISNLWPGHQFQYLPALARNFHDFNADLYYTDWIHTTGDTLGALMCCPGKWEDQTAPAFDLEIPPGESILKKQALLKVVPREEGREPFPLFGHDWKLLVSGPKGESLPPLPLTVSPNKKSFVASPTPLLEPLRKLGATKMKARIVGRWGFTNIATEPLEVVTGCDPAWKPTAEERTDFQIGKDCEIKLPSPWAGIVEKVLFRPSRTGASPMVAKLRDEEDGTKVAVFEPKPGQAGAGTLEISTFGADKPALSRPMTLLEAVPVISDVEARWGDTALTIKGHHLDGVQVVELDGHLFRNATKARGNRQSLVLNSADGKPIEGVIGKKVAASVTSGAGIKTSLEPVPLLPARPKLGEIQVIPVEAKGTGLAVTSTLPIAPTSAPSQISLLAAKGSRFSSDRAFHLVIRNSEEPSEVRPIPPAKIRVTGNNRKVTFTFTPADLLGGRASGKLELQMLDDHTGGSDWAPLPVTFLDLPVILTVQAASPGIRLIGPSLDPIEAVAPSPGGPWEKPSLMIEEGHETLKMTTPVSGSRCYLKVFGWPDLALTLTFPPIPEKNVPGPAQAASDQIVNPPVGVDRRQP